MRQESEVIALLYQGAKEGGVSLSSADCDCLIRCLNDRAYYRSLLKEYDGEVVPVDTVKVILDSHMRSIREELERSVSHPAL